MITIASFRRYALSFPEVTEEPHFDKTSFRVKKKIFATYDEKRKTASLKLSEVDQNVFSVNNDNIVYPVNNKWGKQGWTVINTELVNEDLCLDALRCAYCEVAPETLAKNFTKNLHEQKVTNGG